MTIDRQEQLVLWLDPDADDLGAWYDELDRARDEGYRTVEQIRAVDWLFERAQALSRTGRVPTAVAAVAYHATVRLWGPWTHEYATQNGLLPSQVAGLLRAESR